VPAVLVVCNGPFKSGSTWLYEIARALVNPESLPAEYAEPSWLPIESIRPRRLRSFLARGDLQDRNLVVKQHLSRPRHVRLLADVPGVLVLDIRRDLRDVVVSSYYHQRSRGRAPDDFSRFYWTEGRYYANGVANHHRRWRGHTALTVVYESLVSDFTTEAGGIAACLGRDVSESQLETIRASVGLTSLKDRYATTGVALMESAKFFRRGVPGDWKSHLDEEMLADVAAIERSGLSLASRSAWQARSRYARLQHSLRAAG
jgi:hypothetical protein